MKKTLSKIMLMSIFTMLFSPQNFVVGLDQVSVSENRIINVRDPIDKTDAASKNYVDNKIEGIEKPPAVLQTEGKSETAVMSQNAVTKMVKNAASMTQKSLEKSAKDTFVSKEELFNLIYPVGSIYMSVNSTNPSALFGGNWTSWSQGRVPVGVNEYDYDFNYSEKMGGEKAHTLSEGEMPPHRHGILMTWQAGNTPWGATTTFSNGESDSNANYCMYCGGGQAHNNLQPYITCYMWKRIS